MTTIMKISSRNLAVRRRSLMRGGLAGIIASVTEKATVA